MAACLGGLLALLALPAAAGPLAVVAPDGSCAVRDVAPARLAAIETSLIEEATRLRDTAHRVMADAAAMRLAPARERVPAFGDWAYGWAQSYITAYRVLGLAVRSAAESVAETGQVPLVDRIAAGMATPVREAFRTRVLEPTIPPDALNADLLHTGAVVEASWHVALGEAAAELATMPVVTAPAERGAAPRLDFAAAAAAVTPTLAELAPSDPLALIVEEGADTGMVFLRSMRPMASRLGAVAVRLSEAGSVVAAGSTFGYAIGGMPGVALGAAGGIGLSWGIDWAFNRVDAAFNRPTFEAQALEAISRAEQRLAEHGAAAIQQVLAQRRAALRPPAQGCG